MKEFLRKPGQSVKPEICAFAARGFDRFRSRSHDAAIRVYDEAGNVIGNARARGRVQRVVRGTRETKSRQAVKRDG
jgi:hypothetical protein